VFLEHFGLREQPFGVTPDPRFLYLGEKHREALASLVYGTETDRGFLALIARPGMGKTSLLVQYLEQYQKKGRTCHLFQTDCTSSELLRHVLRDLGIDTGKKDVPGMRDSLNQVLLEEMAAGRRFVLVIDEAQNLDERVLESVRLLSNFETPTKKLMHIVLAGQPQLAEKLAKPSMTQFRQRVSAVIRLNPFSPAETSAYIDHRLRVAGYRGAPLFTDSARQLIAEHSEGIPRNINNLCFNAMSLAYATDSKQVDWKDVREVMSDLEIDSLLPRSGPSTRSFSPIQVAVAPAARPAAPKPPASPVASRAEEQPYVSDAGVARAAVADIPVPEFYAEPKSSSLFPKRRAILLSILAGAAIAAAMTPIWIRISSAWMPFSTARSQAPIEAGSGRVGWLREPSAPLGAKEARELVLYRPSLGARDCRLEFTWKVGGQPVAWIFRAIDRDNYYATAIKVSRAETSLFSVEHFTVFGGTEGPHSDKPLVLTGNEPAIPIRMEVAGSTFKLYVQGNMVDYWNDDRLTSGGLGFLEERDQRAEVEAVQMSFSQAIGMERTPGPRFLVALLRWCGIAKRGPASGIADGV
jgi:type II secretory pathway predicted ATPase ExeA